MDGTTERDKRILLDRTFREFNPVPESKNRRMIISHYVSGQTRREAGPPAPLKHASLLINGAVLGFEVSHPRRKNKDAPRMGHPMVVLEEDLKD
jgi:hypothetical protein